MGGSIFVPGLTVYRVSSYRNAQSFELTSKHPLRAVKLSTLNGCIRNPERIVHFDSYDPAWMLS
jgi:hypothetical protein